MTVTIHIAVAKSKFFRATCFQTCQVLSGLMSGILLPTLRRSSVWSLLLIFRDNLLITFPLTLRRSQKLKVAHSTPLFDQFNQLIIMFTFALHHIFMIKFSVSSNWVFCSCRWFSWKTTFFQGLYLSIMRNILFEFEFKSNLFILRLPFSLLRLPRVLADLPALATVTHFSAF